MSARAVIASGSGRYADPWHPFDETSAAIAGVLREVGFDAEVNADVDDALASLDGADLLVVNAGDPWRGDDETAAAPAASLAGLRSALDRGIGVLATHTAVASLRDYPEWAAAVGAIWMPGLSYHPPRGDTAVRVEDAPELGGLSGFDVDDERYTRLQQIGDRRVVAWHAGDGSPEPAAWLREFGPSRVAVDVLGHDGRSYEAAGHRALVAALARWAARAN
ncbi:ThuA domain-containing protein [Microbacterium halophytorum]|uniref:ThuA domain-containing protein n=1 Tax=Microbacterium halophytorum TaxID=2067568 RepID=UPI001E4F9CE6|nr:ThuA domain-containing protein [Microbacterium halophytorum]